VNHTHPHQRSSRATGRVRFRRIGEIPIRGTGTFGGAMAPLVFDCVRSCIGNQFIVNDAAADQNLIKPSSD
jgi:hypothetical protein